jgi:hypothetical protein
LRLKWGKKIAKHGNETTLKLFSKVTYLQYIHADPVPSFHFNFEPDPGATFHFEAVPDPDSAAHQSDANLRPLVNLSATAAPFFNLHASIVNVHCNPWLHFKPLKLLNFEFTGSQIQPFTYVYVFAPLLLTDSCMVSDCKKTMPLLQFLL